MINPKNASSISAANSCANVLGMVARDTILALWEGDIDRLISARAALGKTSVFIGAHFFKKYVRAAGYADVFHGDVDSYEAAKGELVNAIHQRYVDAGYASAVSADGFVLSWGAAFGGPDAPPQEPPEDVASDPLVGATLDEWVLNVKSKYEKFSARGQPTFVDFTIGILPSYGLLADRHPELRTTLRDVFYRWLRQRVVDTLADQGYAPETVGTDFGRRWVVPAPAAPPTRGLSAWSE